MAYWRTKLLIETTAGLITAFLISAVIQPAYRSCLAWMKAPLACRRTEASNQRDSTQKGTHGGGIKAPREESPRSCLPPHAYMDVKTGEPFPLLGGM